MGNCQTVTADSFSIQPHDSHPLKSEQPTSKRFRAYNSKNTLSTTTVASSAYTAPSGRFLEEDPASGEESDGVPSVPGCPGPNTAQAPATASPVRIRSLLHAPSYSFPEASEEELGLIRYHYTGMSEAVVEAQRSGKPLLCFEIEVPGSERIGREVLSHPLIVEASESLFVSVAPESYRRMPEHFGKRNPHEPRNYVRIGVMDSNSGSEINRITGDDLCVADVASLMVDALKSANLHVPPYLVLLHEEMSARQMIQCGPCRMRRDRVAVFAVSCCTKAEVDFADLEGIIATRSGHFIHHNVIEVTYDSSRLVYGSLVRYALRNELANIVFYQSNDERIASQVEVQNVCAHWKTELKQWSGVIQPSIDPKHALRKTLLKYVPFTHLQSLRANRLVHMGMFHEATRLLSPRQGVVMMQAMRSGSCCRPEYVDMDLVAAWKNVSGRTNSTDCSETDDS